VNEFLLFLIAGLAVFRISSLAAKEDGPYGILEKFRKFVGVRIDEFGNTYGKNEFSRGLLCIWCNSVWIGEIFAIIGVVIGLYHWLLFPVIGLALSTVSIIVEQTLVYLLSHSKT